MTYTKDERLNIGRQIVTQELTRREAMEKYSLCKASIDNYIHLYKESVGMPTSQPIGRKKAVHETNSHANTNSSGMEAYMSMSKEELIKELIKAKANELRAKKGYEVKGDGANKEFISLNSKNTK